MLKHARGDVAFGATSVDRVVRIIVRDDGAGIAEDQRADLRTLLPGRRRSVHAGFGLRARDRVRGGGGPRRRARFRDVARGDDIRDHAAFRSHHRPRLTHILVAGVDLSILDAVAYTLRGEGYDVETAADEETALEATPRTT